MKSLDQYCGLLITKLLGGLGALIEVPRRCVKARRELEPAPYGRRQPQTTSWREGVSARNCLRALFVMWEDAQIGMIDDKQNAQPRSIS